MTAHDKILALFEKDNELTIKEIVDKLGISKQMAHIAVNKLIGEARLERLGRPPKTIYRLLRDQPRAKQETLVIPEKEKTILEKEFLAVTESGNLLCVLVQTTKAAMAFIQSQNADAIGFVPPTIRRELQLMKFIQIHLNLPVPVIEIRKISGIIPVLQKSLSKLEERIRNAENTFAVTERRVFKRVILIDDAVGSGSTLNQIAGKIKEKGVAQDVAGLAVVGSFKGFDVITDV